MKSTSKLHKAQLQQHLIGKEEDMGAYRAEATGIWVVIAAVRQMTEKYNIEEAEIRYGCDGKAALKKSFAEEWEIRTKDRNHNILQKRGRNSGDYPRVSKSTGSTF